jgi:hypothetical protein
LATEAPEAARLLPGLHPPGFRGTACLYFAADQPPLSKPILVLNGEGRGPVDNLCVPSAVAPSYAPAGKSLVSATVVDAAGADEKELESEVRRHLVSWFGPAVESWRHLRTYRIPWPCLPAARWSRQPCRCEGGPASIFAAITGRLRRFRARWSPEGGRRMQ